jgi:hypothetical protein
MVRNKEKEQVVDKVEKRLARSERRGLVEGEPFSLSHCADGSHALSLEQR